MRKIQRVAFSMFLALGTSLVWASAAGALQISEVAADGNADSSSRVLHFVLDESPFERGVRGGERPWRQRVREIEFRQDDNGDWRVVRTHGLSKRQTRRAAIIGRIFLDANPVESRDDGAIPTPEPTALAVFASGLVAAGVALRRRETSR